MSAAVTQLRPLERQTRREHAIGYAVVVYRDAGDVAHLPSPRGSSLTRCGRVALLRLEPDRLREGECVCPGCDDPKGRRS